MTQDPNHGLKDLTEKLTASYREEPRTQRVDERHLPSQEKIVSILADFRRLLFPGFFGHKDLTWASAPFHVGDLLARMRSDLAGEINPCLCMSGECGVQHTVECPSTPECRAKAEAIADAMLAELPEIRRLLALDAQAAYDGDPAAKSINEVIYCYPGFFAVTVYRIAHVLYRLGVPLMPRIMSEYAHSMTGTDIHPGAAIGESFFIDHATGVVIGETCQIGHHVKIYQGVTLGALSFPKDERGRVIKGLKRHPTIEDDVTIYANATILGGQTVIGKGVTVGGNTFVTESIIADSTVIHERPRLKVRSRKNR
jgi:serine O-acetyltransferase